eukprot:5877313-Pyramimonas_sp.AAC.1
MERAADAAETWPNGLELLCQRGLTDVLAHVGALTVALASARARVGGLAQGWLRRCAWATMSPWMKHLCCCNRAYAAATAACSPTKPPDTVAP